MRAGIRIVVCLSAGAVFCPSWLVHSGEVRPDSGLSAEQEAQIAAAVKEPPYDPLMDEADHQSVFLSARAYRAIQAIELYRKQVQAKELTAAERVFENFEIWVNAPDRAMTLKGDEKRTCFEIALWARRLPGEPLMLDTPRRGGRSAVYVVRKEDNRVLRAEIDRPERWKTR